MRRSFGESVSNKAVLVVMGVMVTTYFLLIVLPLAGIFSKLDSIQIVEQLQNPIVIDAIQLSLYTSVIATLIAIALAVPTGYFMATRRFPGKPILDTIIDLPLVLPPAVAGVALLYAFAPKGLLGPILNYFHITIPGYTVAVVLAEIFVASPFLVRAAKLGFENVDRDVLNSARILSGSRFRVFRTVALPLTIRAIISGTMMTWARAMGEFGATLMFAGNLPGITQTMPLAIYTLIYSEPLAGVMLSIILIVISFSVLIGVKLVEQRRFGYKK
jgi:molybdate transport system permease protein